MEPINVYLDTSDYWLLAGRLKKGDQAAISLIEKLERLVTENRIEIRYSGIHVFELINFDADHQSSALDRCQLLARLTQGKCLNWISDLAVDEVSSAKASTPHVRALAQRENNAWLNLGEIPVPSTSTAVRDVLRQELRKRGASRQVARQAERKLVARGKFTKLAEKIVKDANSKNQDELEKNLPISPGAIRQLRDSLLDGKLDLSSLPDILKPEILNPVALSGRLRAAYPEIGENADILYKICGNMMAGLAATRQQLAEIVEGYGTIKKMPFDTSANIRRFYERLILAFGGDKVSDNEGFENLRGRLPLIEAMAIAATEYSRSIMVNLQTKLKGSDGADIMHAAYIPYVDVFRADTRMLAVVKPVCERFKVELVGKISDLETAISAKLGISI